jgi:hypothetical protein
MKTILESYLDRKQDHPKFIILMRSGDNYETYLDDAIKINRVTGIEWIDVSDANGNLIPAIALPVSGIEMQLRKLIAYGLRVAICEPTEHGSTYQSAWCDSSRCNPIAWPVHAATSACIGQAITFCISMDAGSLTLMPIASLFLLIRLD